VYNSALVKLHLDQVEDAFVELAKDADMVTDHTVEIIKYTRKQEQYSITTGIFTGFLNWRTCYGAIGTINTTISFLRFKEGIAIFTFIKKLTGFSWHGLFFLKTTLGTCYY